MRMCRRRSGGGGGGDGNGGDWRRTTDLVVEGVRDCLDDRDDRDDGESIAAGHLSELHDGALQESHPPSPHVGKLGQGDFGEFDCERTAGK